MNGQNRQCYSQRSAMRKPGGLLVLINGNAIAVVRVVGRLTATEGNIGGPMRASLCSIALLSVPVAPLTEEPSLLGPRLLWDIARLRAAKVKTLD
jgi:hypothetical protein